jgi:hypothetical protein
MADVRVVEESGQIARAGVRISRATAFAKPSRRRRSCAAFRRAVGRGRQGVRAGRAAVGRDLPVARHREYVGSAAGLQPGPERAVPYRMLLDDTLFSGGLSQRGLGPQSPGGASHRNLRRSRAVRSQASKSRGLQRLHHCERPNMRHRRYLADEQRVPADGMETDVEVLRADHEVTRPAEVSRALSLLAPIQRPE